MKAYDFEGKRNICGAKIREARRKKGLTQEDFAARMQLNGVMIERNVVSRMEAGIRFIPDFELPVYAKVLGVSVNWLLSIEE